LKSIRNIERIKEDLARKEHAKEAAIKLRDKQAEDARELKRIRQNIKADREELRQKTLKKKAERETKAPSTKCITSPLQPSSSVGQVQATPAYMETRLRLRVHGESIQKIFSIDTTLSEVATAVYEEKKISVEGFIQAFPKKVWQRVDFSLSLKEAGLVPSASLILTLREAPVKTENAARTETDEV